MMDEMRASSGRWEYPANWMVLRVSLLLLLGLLLPSLAHAFCLMRVTRLTRPPGAPEPCCVGDLGGWPPEDLPLAEWVNDGTAPSLHNGIRMAYQAWSSVPASFFSFADSGLTSAILDEDDGINVIAFSQDPRIFPPGSSTIAFSRCVRESVHGDWRALDCDILFNDVGFDFSEDPGPNEFDVVGISAHELGHNVGIAHTGPAGGPLGCGPLFAAATMYGFGSEGNTRERTLELDDMAALVQIYPRWVIAGGVREIDTGSPIPFPSLLIEGAAVSADTIVRGTIPFPLPGDGTWGPTYVGGAVAGDSAGAFAYAVTETTFTLITSAIGYYSDTTVVHQGEVDTLLLDVRLRPTSRGSLVGRVVEASSGEGIAARVVLLLGGVPYDSALTDSTTGEYTFPSLPITNPPTVVYTGLIVRPELPYPVTAFAETLGIVDGPPTVRDIALSPAQVLIVDDDGGDAIERFVVPVVDSLGRTFVHYDVAARGGGTAAALALFPLSTTVVWLTGSEGESTLTASDQAALADLLASGGRLLLSGQDIAEELAVIDPAFLEGTLRAAHGGTSSVAFARPAPRDPVLAGLGVLVTAGSRGANNQTSRDILVPQEGAVGILFYAASPLDTASRDVAGIRAGGPAESRWALLGFGLEAVNRPNLTDTTKVTRRQLLGRLLDWFEGPVGVAGGGPGVVAPRAFSLGPNFPNPFNPSTTIPFSVPAADRRAGNDSGRAGPGRGEAMDSAGRPVRVSLRIYNIRGELVRILLDEDRAPGEYRAVWDRMSDSGAGVASGVYFYRLGVEGRAGVRRMVLLK